MHPTHQGGASPKDLLRLLRLRDVRVDAAQAAVRVQRATCEQAEAAVTARERALADARAQVVAQAQYTVGVGVQDLPRRAAMLAAYRARLEDQLERTEYGLLDDRETLADETARLRDCQQVWTREQSRRDGIEEALRQSRRALSHRADVMAENEADERRPAGPIAMPGAAASRP